MAFLSSHPLHTSLSSSSLSTLRNSHPLANPKTIPSTFQHLTFPSSKTLIPNFKPFEFAAVPSTIAIETNSSSDSLKARLKKGETLYGIFLLAFSPTLAEIAGLSGYDFAVVDMEHGHGGISDALPCLHALAATNTAAILRLPESSAAWAKKALDLGPQGIMFPMIDSPKSARKAVSYCLFPPKGVRGSAHPIVRASGYGINEGYLSNYEEELLIMCQVECEDGVKKIDEIAAVDGVDCIQMGPKTCSMQMHALCGDGISLRFYQMANLTKPPRFISFLYCSLLFIVSIQTKVLCNTYKVGDLDSWGIPTSSNPQIYSTWSEYHNLTMGDSLFFLYPPSRDSVIQVRDVESYTSCNLKDPILHMNDGNSLFNITKPGNFYFIGGVEGHCEKSQKLHIFVYGNGSYPDSSAPGPDSAAAAPSYPTVFGSIPAQASASPFLKIPVFMISAAVISCYML